MEHIHISGNGRMSGKTTIAYGIKRELEHQGKKVLHIRSMHELPGIRSIEPDIIIWDDVIPPAEYKVTRRIHIDAVAT